MKPSKRCVALAGVFLAAVAQAAAPLPPAAIGPPIPAKGYLLEPLGDGLYWVTDGVYQVIFLATGSGVVAVDAPPSLGRRYLQAIAEVTSEPVRWVVYSHAHADHIGAAGSLFPDAEFIAQEETAELLARARDPARPVPTRTFERHMKIGKGERRLELDYRGVNHEPGNIFIFAPRQGVLMLVDVVFPGWVPFAHLAVSKDIPGFFAAVDQALAYDFRTFVGGHLTRLGTREDVLVAREHLQDLRANAARALQTVDFAAIARETGTENPWLLFETYLDAVARACEAATVPAWVARLGGTDVFTYRNCWTMAESLRID